MGAGGRLLTATLPSYDGHGNTTALAGQSLRYDVADRHLASTVADTTISYQRDATDRIVARTVTVAGLDTETLRYAHTGGGDTPDLTLDAAGALLEATFPLPGGVLLTHRGATDRWAYPNIPGDLIATADAQGARLGPLAYYDPDGRPYDPTSGGYDPAAVPDTRTGQTDYGWLGQHQRPYDHQLTPATLDMGARPYSPTLGRFLETDPIDGGSDNNYDYCNADPINCTDLDGNRAYYGGGSGAITVKPAVIHTTGIGGPVRKVAHVARAAKNAQITMPAMAAAWLAGGSCMPAAEFMVQCTGLSAFPETSGIQLGNAYLTGARRNIGPTLLSHESVHATQWAILGPSFPALYGYATLTSVTKGQGPMPRSLV